MLYASLFLNIILLIFSIKYVLLSVKYLNWYVDENVISLKYKVLFREARKSLRKYRKEIKILNRKLRVRNP
jgi:cell division protein FtsL